MYDPETWWLFLTFTRDYFAEKQNWKKSQFFRGNTFLYREYCQKRGVHICKNRFRHRGKFFFYLGFLSRTFTNHRTAGKGGGHFLNSSLSSPPASQILRHYPGNYCRELTSAQILQPTSNQEPLISERKSVTTKLRALKVCTCIWNC